MRLDGFPSLSVCNPRICFEAFKMPLFLVISTYQYSIWALFQTNFEGESHSFTNESTIVYQELAQFETFITKLFPKLGKHSCAKAYLTLIAYN